MSDLRAATSENATPGQTIGPFFGYALPYDGGGELVPRAHPAAVRLHGYIEDGAGDGIPDALIELWQADPDGATVAQQGSLHRDGWTFTGWGRAETDRTGHYSFTTLRPGGAEAPFFALTIFARGLLDRLVTRAYLPGSPGLADDPTLARVPVERRPSLIAVADDAGYRFDLRLQGEDETVFFDHRAGRASDACGAKKENGAFGGPNGVRE